MLWNLKKIWPIVAAFTLATNFMHADLANPPNLEKCPAIVDLDTDSPDAESCPAAVSLDNPVLPNLDESPAAVDLGNPFLTGLENRLASLESIQETMNPAAMPLTRNGWDCQISADALLWQLQADSLTSAVEITPTALPISACSIKQKYNWGFRIGLDWTTPHDNWDIATSWTHVIGNGHGICSSTPNFLVNTQGSIIFFFPEETDFSFTTANAKYHNRLDQICLNTGREFFISKWVTLRPYFGLRTDWLCQRLRTDCSGIAEDPTFTVNTQQKNTWWGIGIESGLNAQWSFCRGFSLYGNIATAIEYGLQKLTAVDLASGVILNGKNVFNTSYRICRPILDLQLGLGWDYNFCEDRFHLGLKLGWENHIYFNQSHFLSYNAVNYSDNSHIGDLTYQGWTLHASFDF